MIAWLKRHIGQRSLVRLLWHRFRALFAAMRYGFPARRLAVIGVTGTDGKTTTCGMITHILLHAGHRVCSASTACFEINGERRENATHLTSMDPFALQKFLREAVTAKCEYAVIEMSSHGLVQGRCSFTWPVVAAITNTALEHLDYHGSMEQYRKDKAILFQMLRDRGTKVLNGADASFAMYRSIPSERTVVFGGSGGSHGDIELTLSDTSAGIGSCGATLHVNYFEHASDPLSPTLPRRGRESSNVLNLSIPHWERESSHALHLSIPGLFNLENALCAIGCAHALGIPIEECVGAISSFQSIPGRLEPIDEGQDFSVFVDFAVSPQAYEKTLETMRAIAGERGRVLVLCSSCGNRMPEKRPEIGKICSKLADVVVACEDETYGEDPHAVLEEVWSGVDRKACEAHKIFDRREAITFLMSQARTGDAVVLCGMGPFSTFTKLTGRVPWDEREVAREILRQRKKSASPRGAS